MRLFRALLYLYPRYFRNEYRAELCRAYAERVRGRSALAAFFSAFAETVPGALAVRWDHLRQDTAAAMTQPTLGVDVKLAFRQMAKTPLFSAVVVAVLGLGIGINAGMLTLLGAYAWQPAPGITRDARLARLLPQATSGGEDPSLQDSWLSLPDLEALRARHDVFGAVAAWNEANMAADFGQGPELLEGHFVTGNFFSMLGVRMAAGTGVLPEDDPALAQSVVIDHSLWLTFFNASDTAIGSTIRVLNMPFKVVGVAPALFTGVDVLELGNYLVWLPLSARTILAPDGPGQGARRNEPFLEAVAQLADGVRPSSTERVLTPLAAQLARERRASNDEPRLVIGAERLTGMRSTNGETRELIMAFMVIIAMVVLITCTNVGALLLGRAVSRRREIGVRLSLGATRLRLVRQLLTESLVYAVLGAALGIALFALVARLAYAYVENMPPIGFTPEPATFLYAAIFAVVTTLAMGLVPALHATRADIGEVIKGSARLAVKRSRLQSAFVVAQLASSMPVLIVTSLVLASMSRAASGGNAPAPRTIVSMRAMIVRPSESDSAADMASLERMVARVAAEPGVNAAAASISTGRIDQLRYMYVTPGYFQAREMPLLRGRAPTLADAGRPVIVVNELAARRLWPGENPLGKRVERRATRYGGAQSFEVIGVTSPAAYDLEDPQAEVFAPLAFAPYVFGPRLTINTWSDARTMVPRLRQVIAEAEPYAALTQINTVAEHAEERMLDAQRTNVVALVIGFAALILASLGLYAIIANSVAQRTREIGVRLAIGAAPGTVIGEFFRHGMKVSVVGLVIGMPITIVAVKMVESGMLDYNARDLFAVAVIVPILLGVAALASWLPARRAGKVDPLIALQAE